MDIFDLSIKEFKQEIQEIIDNYKPEELLTELKQCSCKTKEIIDKE